MGGSAESACVAPDAFVRGAPRASLWRGAFAFTQQHLRPVRLSARSPFASLRGRGTDEGVRPYTIFSPTTLACVNRYR